MRAAAVLLLFTATAPAADWPAFLGQGFDASGLDADAIPVEWSPEKNIAWQVTLPGYGQSSPVVFGDHVFVTSVEGPMKEKCTVVALNLSDGQELWRHSLDSSDQVKSSRYVSRAAPTPVVDAQRVICFFESGDLISLDHDGQVLWQRSLTKEFGRFKNRFCIAASPAQLDDRLFILADHEGPSYLLAIDKATGEDIWKAERTSRISWSSPAIVPVDGQPQLVISSAGSVDGYDPATGTLLWTKDDVGGNTATTPISAGDGLVLIGASPGPRGESAAVAAKSNLLLRVASENGDAQVSEVWRAGKALSTFSSPTMYQGYGYWVNRAGVVFCFDVETGEEQYAKRLAETCWATPLGIGDRLYFFGQTGKTTVIQSGPEFKQLATNRLWEPDEEDEAKQQSGGRRRSFGGRTQYGAAAVNNRLLVRTGDILYCVGQTR